jgi:excisionase family DNA binding protein
MDALLSIDRAAELLGISPWTVRRWITTRKLAPVRLGRRLLIEPREVERLIEEGRVEPCAVS